MKKLTSNDAGCWSDNTRGIYQGEHIIEIAENFGFVVPVTDMTDERKAYSEFHNELVDDAISYLNTIAPNGYYFGYNDSNDFGLWQNDEN